MPGTDPKHVETDRVSPYLTYSQKYVNGTPSLALTHFYDVSHVTERADLLNHGGGGNSVPVLACPTEP